MKKLEQALEKIALRLEPAKQFWFFIFIIWRLLLLMLMVISQATVLQKGQWTQYLYFRNVAQLSDRGYFPLVNQWIEYPPVFPWLTVGLYKFSTLISSGHIKLVIFYGLLGLIFVACEVGILYLIYKIALKIHAKQQAMIASIIFAITALPTYIIYGWFDPIAAFFLMWGLERLINGYVKISAITSALGGLTKLFPLILAPVGFRILPTIKQKLSYVTLITIITILPFFVFYFVGPQEVTASLRWLLNKSTYETIWALIDGYYSFGVAPGAEQFINIDNANWVAHPTKVPWNLITGIFAAVGLYIYTRPLRNSIEKSAVILTGIIIQMMLLYLKGFSPQFIIWFLPFVPLILPNAKGFLYSLGFSILNILEFPIYFTFFEGQIMLLSTIIIVRTVLVLIVAVEYWRCYKTGPIIDSAPRWF